MRPKLVWYAVAGVVFFSFPLNCLADTSVSSAASLLSPKLHPGETLAWKLQIANYRGELSSLVVRCIVVARKQSGYIIEQDRDKGEGWGAFTPGAVYLRNGTITSLNGRQLSAWTCPLYRSDVFGIPPSELRPGVSWLFSNSGDVPGGLWPNAHGTVTVTHVDPARPLVQLHVVYAGAGLINESSWSKENGWRRFSVYKSTAGTLDMRVADGGVIVDRMIRARNDPQGYSHLRLVR